MTDNEGEEEERMPMPVFRNLELLSTHSFRDGSIRGTELPKVSLETERALYAHLVIHLVSIYLLYMGEIWSNGS